MSDTPKRLAGPAFVASSATNIFNASSALIYTNITQINLENVTSGTVTVTLYVGATGASASGTQIIGPVVLAANSYNPYYFNKLVLKSTDFLTGADASGSSTVVTVLGTQVVVP